jgi:hypothetical protein
MPSPSFPRTASRFGAESMSPSASFQPRTASRFGYEPSFPRTASRFGAPTSNPYAMAPF